MSSDREKTDKTTDRDDELIERYLDSTAPPLPPRFPIGPPDVQPGEVPIESDE